MSTRGAALVVAVVLSAAIPARAQGQGQAPPSYQQLAAHVADLQARVAKLEGNITAADLAGTYSLVVMDTSMSGFHPATPGAPALPATISTSSTNAMLTLNADGTGTANLIRCAGSTLTQGTWALTGGDSCDGSSTASAVTWSYANGVSTITFVNDNEAIPFTVALGGRLLVIGDSAFHAGDPSSDHLLFLATRLR
jgi:hypothetical protein